MRSSSVTIKHLSVGGMDVRLRTLTSNESDLIFELLKDMVESSAWARMQMSDEPLQDAIRVLARYWQDWGRQGDLGVVAETGGTGCAVSCAWVRLFSHEEADAALVGDNIPELKIVTISEARGLGMGTEVVHALLGLCKSRYAGVSVTVDRGETRFYERLGFRKVMIRRRGTTPIVMLLRFDRNRPVRGPRRA